MSNITIRELNESDYGQLSEILIENTTKDTIKNYSKEIVDLFLENCQLEWLSERFRDRKCFWLFIDSKLVGNICIKWNELKTFYIALSEHRKWYWRKLFEYAENYLKNKWEKYVKVASLLWSEWFYKKLWFTVVQKTTQATDKNPDIKYEEYEMKKDI